MTRRTARRRLAGALLPIAATTVVLAAAGCEGKTSDRDVAFVSTDDTATLHAGRQSSLLGKTAQAVIVDPRPEHIYRQSHIPGALNIPIEQLRDRGSELRGFDTVIVCGDVYGDPLARAAGKTLMDMGLDDVRVLEGGLDGWTRAGYETEPPTLD